VLSGLNSLPCFLESAGFPALFLIDKLDLLLFGKPLEGFHGLVGAHQRLPAQIDLPGQKGPLPIQSAQVARELAGVEAPRAAGVDIDVPRAAAQNSQLFDLSQSIGFGLATPGKQLFVVAQDVGQKLLAHLTLILPQLEQRIEFE
jgi:hypothetical protein